MRDQSGAIYQLSAFISNLLRSKIFWQIIQHKFWSTTLHFCAKPRKIDVVKKNKRKNSLCSFDFWFSIVFQTPLDSHSPNLNVVWFDCNSRVRGTYRYASLPWEPDLQVSRHPAQALFNASCKTRFHHFLSPAERQTVCRSASELKDAARL